MTTADILPPRPGVVVLRLLAAVSVPAALALNLSVAGRLTLSMVVVWGLTIFWWPVFIRVQYGLMLLAATGLFLLGGFLMGWVSGADHVVPRGAAIALGVTYATYIGGVGALVWASRMIGVHWVVFSYGMALAAGTLLDPHSYALNPWKFGFAIPVALMVLSLIDRVGSNGAKILALGALCAMCVLNDYRSGLAMFAIAAAILTWQRLRRRAAREPSIVAVLLGLVVIGGTIYYTATRLLISGFLGGELQSRSQAQVKASGSLLLGGRPEWTVTIRLFRENPWGFGFGTLPSTSDYELGREGFDSIHLLSQENYLKHYVFSGGFRLHSIAADMWVGGGPAGILLALVIIWILVGSLANALAHRTATAVQTYLSLLVLWNIGFSPVYSNFPQVVLGVAVAVMAAGPAQPLLRVPPNAKRIVDPGYGALVALTPIRPGDSPVTGAIDLSAERLDTRAIPRPTGHAVVERSRR